MKASTTFATFFVAASQLLAVSAQKGVQPPKTDPIIGTQTSQGCFKSLGSMKDAKVVREEVSMGKCKEICEKKQKPAFALSLDACWCGDLYPPEEDIVKDSLCNEECNAFPEDVCGGFDSNGEYYSVWNTGISRRVLYEEKEETTTSAPPAATSTTSAVKSSTPTDDQATTSSPAPEEDKKDDSGPSIGPIVGGVVAGVAVVCGIVGGLFFFMRRRRNSEIEEEYRRNAAVNAFISGSKPPSSSAGSISMTDSRLDPIKAHRLSDGSIADNEDYSRKILRVTNA